MRKAEKPHTGYLMRSTCKMIKNDMTSWSFALSILCMFAALFFSQDQVPPEGHTAIASIFLFPLQANNAMGLIALGAGICSAANYARDRTTGFILLAESRIGKRRYLIARSLSSSVSTGMAAALAVLLFFVFCLFQTHGLFYADVAQWYFLKNLLDQGMFGLWIVIIVLIEFMYGMLLGGCGVLATSFLPNRYIGYTMPFIGLFLWAQICKTLQLSVWINPYELAKCKFFFPSTAETVGVYFAALIGTTAILLIIFVIRGLKEAK